MVVLVVSRMAWQAEGGWLCTTTTSATCRRRKGITGSRLLKPIQEELIGNIMANVQALPQVGFACHGIARRARRNRGRMGG